MRSLLSSQGKSVYNYTYYRCWKGSFFDGSTRRSSQIYPEKTPLGVTRTTSAMVVNEKEIDDKSVSKVNAQIKGILR